MKKLALATLAAASMVAMASPAAAQVAATGTVNITGNVAKKCLVTNAGTPTPNFGGTVDLGDLANTADGTLTPGLAGIFNAAATAEIDFRVVCTSPGTAVSVTATPLTTAAPQTTGYANRVDYNADVTFSLVGGDQTVSDSSTGASSATTGVWATDRLATGATNVKVRTSAFNTTAAGTNAVLLAGTYGGNISVTITANP
jgi:hypothetical protein